MVPDLASALATRPTSPPPPKPNSPPSAPPSSSPPAALDPSPHPRLPTDLRSACARPVPSHVSTPLIAPSVAPGTDLLGIMLPYTPLHHLLFRPFRPHPSSLDPFIPL